jgi:hypothetical protein
LFFVIGNSHEIEGENLMKNKQKTIKIIGSVAIILIAILVITKIITYNVGNKSIFSVFFKGQDSNVAGKLLESPHEIKKIGKYSIELDQQLYDSKTGVGYLLFKIKKENGVPEINLNDSGQCSGIGFGENQRLYFEVGASNNTTYEIKGNTLYAYMDFIKDKDKDFYVKLGDYQTRKEYNFNIKDTSYVKTYKDGDTTVEISPLGVSISAKEKSAGISLVVYTDKGKKELINTKKDIGTNAHESSEAYKGKSKSYQYILKFKNLLDISKIEKVEFNGKSE